MDFSGKVVLITGASAGIGAAIAIKFAENKASVVLVARNEKRLKEVSAKCRKVGPEPLVIVADVSKDMDVDRVFTSTINRFAKIDILINNAGIVETTAIDHENAMEVYDRVMNTNLRSAVYFTHTAAPHLIESKGNIINISSIAAVSTIAPTHFAYCTSKAGMDHFTRSVALDLGPKGVRANTVNPGPVRTDIVTGMGVEYSELDAFWRNMEERMLLGRVSEPEEIVDLVLFLASDKAKAITGSSFITDNGVLIKRDIRLD